MSIDSSMDKVLERRQEVETQLSRSAELSSNELADFSRELSELRPVCEQIELVRALESELKDAITMFDEAAGDDEMLAMVEAELPSQRQDSQRKRKASTIVTAKR